MAHFDNQIPDNPDQHFQQDRIGNLEYFVTKVQAGNQRLVEQVRVLSEIARQPVHYYASQNPTFFDLHIPPPLPFNGAATDLPDFKIKLHNFFRGSPGLYDQDSKNLLYSGNFTVGQAAIWFQSQVDPSLITSPHPGT